MLCSVIPAIRDTESPGPSDTSTCARHPVKGNGTRRFQSSSLRFRPLACSLNCREYVSYPLLLEKKRYINFARYLQKEKYHWYRVRLLPFWRPQVVDVLILQWLSSCDREGLSRPNSWSFADACSWSGLVFEYSHRLLVLDVYIELIASRWSAVIHKFSILTCERCPASHSSANVSPYLCLVPVD